MSKFTELSAKDMNSTNGGSLLAGILCGIFANAAYDLITNKNSYRSLKSVLMDELKRKYNR